MNDVGTPDPVDQQPAGDTAQVRSHNYAGPDAIASRMVWRCPAYDYPHTCKAPPVVMPGESRDV